MGHGALVRGMVVPGEGELNCNPTLSAKDALRMGHPV